MNREFVELACTLADELNIDELVAAEFIQESSVETKKLDMSPLQGGMAMYHTRRQYVLELIRFFLFQAVENTPMGKVCKGFVEKLGNQLQKTLDAMQFVENTLIELDEKEKRGQFLGQTQNVDFMMLLKFRRDFLYREHDMMGQILCGSIENKISADDFIKILNVVENQSAYNSLFIHYITPILVYSSTVDSILSQTNYTTSTEDAKKVHKKLMEKKEWKLPVARGASELIFLSYYSALCRTEESGVNYLTEVLDPVRRAIDDGGLELIMAIASDIGKPRPVHYFDFKSVMQSRIPVVEIDLTDEILQMLVNSLEKLVESIVGNLPDILKEMLASEEDSYHAMMEEDANPDDIPGVDLERFFLFISYLYSERPGAADQFWNDAEGNLYGFVQWASQCSVPFISAAFCDMLASLAAGNEAAESVHRFMTETLTIKAKKGNRITWEYLFKAFMYYSEQLRPDTAPLSNSLNHQARVVLPVQDVPELDDDTMIVLTSYFRLISTVVKNDDEARAWMLNQEVNIVKLLFSLLQTQTSLVGPVLDVVASFALTNNVEGLVQLWEVLDNWAFNTIIYSPDGGVIMPSMPAKDRLFSLFKSFDDIVGLVTLLETLMRAPKTDGLYTLPYPDDLGSAYRNPGVWPYVDFLIGEVFFSSAAPDFSPADRLSLQLPCLLFMKHSLELFDPEIARLAASAGVNADAVVKSQSFLSYLKVHPCAPTMTHLFSDKIYGILIGLASSGYDEIEGKKSDNNLVKVVEASLDVVNLVLDLQGIFIDIIVNEFKFGDNGPQFSTHGLRSFEDALLFNLPVVSHLALYVSLANLKLSRSALKLLDRVSQSPQFMSSTGSVLDSRIKKNRLLSAFETVDESVRIKCGFVEQLERSLESYEGVENEAEGLQIKFEILSFLLETLRSHAKEPTIAHFLLGFKIESDGSLSFENERGGINSEVSLLHSILQMLEYSTATSSAHDLDLSAAQMSSSCSEIIKLLVENQNSCILVLDYLRENDFAATSLKSEPIIDSNALWHGIKYSQSSDFFTKYDSAQTMVSFFTHRTAMLDYLSVEIHVSAENGSLSLVQRYLDSLVNLDIRQTFQSAKVLAFLDVLEFQTGDDLVDDIPAIQAFGPQVSQHFYRAEYEQGDDTAIVELQHLLKLKGLEFVSQGRISSLDDSEYGQAANEIIQTFSSARMAQRIRNTQLSCLMSWSKLVLILVNDTELSAGDRSTFILETLQSIVPKLADYAQWDVEFAEQFASLAVSLYKLYQQDSKKIGGGSSSGNSSSTIEYDRTYSLFKAALNSMQTPLSTAALRADLYVICYSYLKSCVGNHSLVKQNIQTVRNAGDKLLETVCTDAISGDGVPRLTALVFLENLSMNATLAKSTFMLDSLVRYNLLLLLVRSIKRTDVELSNRQNLTNSQLLYEINVFKATLCFLLQMAQTRTGANQMLQCCIFSTLDSCHFLKIDPDVGIGGINAVSTFYEILIPVFQVVAAILLSMGAENQPVIDRVGQFVDLHQQLFVSVLKKEVVQGANDSKLQELVKLAILLMSLTQQQ